MGLGGTGKGGIKGWVGGRIGMKWLRIRKGTEKRDGKKSGTPLRQCCSSSFCITHHQYWKENLSVYILEIQNICVPPTQQIVKHMSYELWSCTYHINLTWNLLEYDVMLYFVSPKYVFFAFPITIRKNTKH